MPLTGRTFSYPEHRGGGGYLPMVNAIVFSLSLVDPHSSLSLLFRAHSSPMADVTPSLPFFGADSEVNDGTLGLWYLPDLWASSWEVSCIDLSFPAPAWLLTRHTSAGRRP